MGVWIKIFAETTFQNFLDTKRSLVSKEKWHEKNEDLQDKKKNQTFFNAKRSVTTLALGSRLRQGLAKVRAKSEPKNHISCSQKCKKV